MNSRRTPWSRHDLLLLLMAVIWGANYSVVKAALAEIPPLAFNAVRLLVASLLFLAALGLTSLGTRRHAWVAPVHTGRARLTTRDWVAVGALGLIGHFVYQLCFMGGLARTSAGNSSLILSCSPVAVALLTAAAGHERVAPRHWLGIALSVAGVYVLVGHSPSVSGPSVTGDLLTIAAVFCWAAYTVGARPLLERLSPLQVTGFSMAIGTVPYLAVASGELAAVDWPRVTAGAWAAIALSGAFALFVAYLIWYVAVQRIGNLRTSVYSNTIPVVALIVAAVWLREPVTTEKLVGAGAILASLAVTRWSGRTAAVGAPPEE